MSWIWMFYWCWSHMIICKGEHRSFLHAWASTWICQASKKCRWQGMTQTFCMTLISMIMGWNFLSHLTSPGLTTFVTCTARYSILFVSVFTEFEKLYNWDPNYWKSNPNFHKQLQQYNIWFGNSTQYVWFCFIVIQRGFVFVVLAVYK
jgi:hypothetical protein